MKIPAIALATGRTRRPAREPAPRDDALLIGAHADYRREDFVFARTQSLTMRELRWERRIRPIKPWGFNLVADLAWHIFA